AATDLAAVRASLEAAGMTPLSAELTLVPTATVDITEPQEAQRVLRLLDAIEDHDDVQAVHANYDIPEAVLAGYAG
ncbi:MAG: YebC/PmpR family DNA-binding transcriptional regulator, partial [Actinomycetota bacterium]|nr:YebC/PmpR family DNA-binding transcriptional regulator [Actinomycetota bacterium]